MPNLTNQILAISSGVERLSVEMSVINLMGCYCIHSVYLCKHHGIMCQELNSTCLGSLYIQDFTSTMLLCEMKFVNQMEMLQDNWDLVHSPTMFTSYIICLNNTNSEVYVKMGLNHLYISPSCRMPLKDHILILDFSICLDSAIKHSKWDLDEITFLLFIVIQIARNPRF
jgi:hypothetical protein